MGGFHARSKWHIKATTKLEQLIRADSTSSNYLFPLYIHLLLSYHINCSIPLTPTRLAIYLRAGRLIMRWIDNEVN